MSELVLSLFPGIGLLDMAFEEQGFCVVRGPDVLWGGDIKRFHPPKGRFDGVIGGPPCQHWSRMKHMVIQRYGAEKVAEDLIPEYERVVTEAQPSWFLMEEVEAAPEPAIEGYTVSSHLLNNRWFDGEQHRKRRFSFGVRGDRRVDLWHYLEMTAFETMAWAPAVLASGGNKLGGHVKLDRGGKPKNHAVSNMGYKTRDYFVEAIRLQGLPSDFLDKAPFTVEGKIKVIGNGVPLPMGRAIAKAVRDALGASLL
jgi:DNA (cytosine-5)-methyltransferase 1